MGKIGSLGEVGSKGVWCGDGQILYENGHENIESADCDRDKDKQTKKEVGGRKERSKDYAVITFQIILIHNNGRTYELIEKGNKLVVAIVLKRELEQKQKSDE